MFTIFLLIWEMFFLYFFVSYHGKQETWYTKPKKVWNLQKAFSLRKLKFVGLK